MVRSLVFLLFLGILGSGASEAGVLLRAPYQKWPDSEVRVCWANFSGTRIKTCGQPSEIRFSSSKSQSFAAHQKTIREIVEQEFTAEKTGIYFTGWEKCPAGVNAKSSFDVAIILRSNGSTTGLFEGSASLGSACPSERDQSSMAFVAIDLPRDSSEEAEEQRRIEGYDEGLKFTALHEFAHVAGLQHEDDGRLGTGVFSRIHKNPEKGIPVTSYDPHSIVSYEFKFRIRTKVGLDFVSADKNFLRPDPLIITREPLPRKQFRFRIRTGLSSGDQHALRCLYGYAEAQRKEICNERYRPWDLEEGRVSF